VDFTGTVSDLTGEEDDVGDHDFGDGTLVLEGGVEDGDLMTAT
jgi:hypothetical protein